MNERTHPEDIEFCPVCGSGNTDLDHGRATGKTTVFCRICNSRVICEPDN